MKTNAKRRPWAQCCSPFDRKQRLYCAAQLRKIDNIKNLVVFSLEAIEAALIEFGLSLQDIDEV